MAGRAGGYNPRVRHAAARAMGLCPGREVRGTLRVPGSKSIAQRALVCASLAEGASEIAGLPDGADVGAALRLVAGAGARVERLSPGTFRLTGRPPGLHRGWSPAQPVSAGESGTLARCATAALALCGVPGRWSELRAEGTLLGRKSPALFEALAAAGVGVEFLGSPGTWPARVRAIGPPSQVDIARPASSQEVSALLLALAAYPDEIALFVTGGIPSRPYLQLTQSALVRFGASVHALSLGSREVFAVRGPLRAAVGPFVVEPDASSSAVALAAGCLSRGRLEVEGIPGDSTQPDACAVEILARFGCRTGRGACLAWAEGSPTRGAEVDCEGCPDLAPVLAAVAAAAAIRTGASSRLTGLGTLAGKESDRIAVLAQALTAIGVDVDTGADFLAIDPPIRVVDRGEILLDPQGDHRMAFAFALFGLFVDGVWVSDPGCVGKSWPGFWDDLERLGFEVAERK